MPPFAASNARCLSCCRCVTAARSRSSTVRPPMAAALCTGLDVSTSVAFFCCCLPRLSTPATMARTMMVPRAMKNVRTSLRIFVALTPVGRRSSPASSPAFCSAETLYPEGAFWSAIAISPQAASAAQS